jgi:hypothetical protein
MRQGPTDQELGVLTRQFLEAEPQWLEYDVRYFPISGRDEPQLYLSTRAAKAFSRWLAAHKLVKYPEKVDRFCDWLDQRGSGGSSSMSARGGKEDR